MRESGPQQFCNHYLTHPACSLGPLLLRPTLIDSSRENSAIEGLVVNFPCSPAAAQEVPASYRNFTPPTSSVQLQTVHWTLRTLFRKSTPSLGSV
jgi:hypothetical protein